MVGRWLGRKELPEAHEIGVSNKLYACETRPGAMLEREAPA